MDFKDDFFREDNKDKSLSLDGSFKEGGGEVNVNASNLDVDFGGLL